MNRNSTFLLVLKKCKGQLFSLGVLNGCGFMGILVGKNIIGKGWGEIIGWVVGGTIGWYISLIIRSQFLSGWEK